MTQRTKYRTGRRSIHRRADKNVKNAQVKSVLEPEETLKKEITMMNEKNETQELEQVETKKVEQSLEVPETIVEEVEQNLSNEPVNEVNPEDVPDIEGNNLTGNELNASVETSTESVGSENTSSQQSLETVHSGSRGGVGKIVVGGAILVALAGGGYYYAQQNNLFGLGNFVSTASTAETNLSTTKTTSESSAAVSITNSTTPVVSSTEPTANNTEPATNSTEPTANSTNLVSSNVVESTSSATTSGTGDKVSATNATETTANVADIVINSTEPAVSSTEPTTNSTESVSSNTVEQTLRTAIPEVGGMESAINTTEPVKSNMDIATDSKTEAIDTASSNDEPADVSAEVLVATASLEARLAAQEQQIAQLVQQLKEAQSVEASQRVNVQKVQSLRAVLNELAGLYQTAEFESSVRVNKENALKALTVMKNQLALQTDAAWDSVRQALNTDIETLIQAPDINLEQVFKASTELALLVKTAPFVSAEGNQETVSTSSSSASSNTVDTTTNNDSWLDQAINHVERLPAQAYEAIRSDLGGLIKVEKLSNPAVATMSIEAIQEQRAETLRQLSIAQEALLKRQERVWKEAMQKVEQQLMTYYNLNIEKTQQAVALARQLMKTSVQSTLPALSNTQQALEQFARQLRIEN